MSEEHPTRKKRTREEELAARREAAARYRARHPDRHRAAVARYRARNAEKCRNDSRLYREEHREEVNAKQRERYRANRKELLERGRQARVRNLALLWGIKEKKGCHFCDVHHPACLEFHHLDPKTKSFDLARMGSRSVRRILAEVAKCIVVCVNCHRKLDKRNRALSRKEAV